MKFLKYILLMCTSITVLIGFQAITDQSNVFALSDAVCCDDGLCENNNPAFSTRCTSSASGMVKSACEELSMTCKECVDLTFSACICYNGGSDYCMKNDHTLYYGALVPCDLHK
jgi:hypothetical protein